MLRNYRLPRARQTPWACGPDGRVWYATIHRDIDDEVVIENAKRIVDGALPEQPSTYWQHHYAFIRREFLLNLLLAHYERHEAFPVGAVCLVDKWMWEAVVFKHRGEWCRWSSFVFGVAREDYNAPGRWIKIPSLQSVLRASSQQSEVAHG